MAVMRSVAAMLSTCCARSRNTRSRSRVWGYYDLVGCTLIDNGDTYRHRLMIVRENDDGTIDARMETNPEAAARERTRRQDAIARDSDCPF
jgi:hypothetical protein